MKPKFRHIAFYIIAATLFCGHSLHTHAASNNVYWTEANGQVYYSINAKVSPVVKIALQLFAHDMKAVTGREAKERSGATLQIYQLDMLSNKEFAAVEKLGVPLHQFITKRDAFYIATRNGKIVVTGSDARGTAYGILELSRMAGVSDWTDWNDAKPQARKSLGVKTGFQSLQIPTTTYRAVEMNASRWMSRHNQSMMARLMLRLRANTLWLSNDKHEASYDKAVADSFELAIGSGNKVTELQGKKHKKHKHNVEHVKTIWSNNQLWLKCSAPGLVALELNGNPDAYVANVYDPKAAAYQLQLIMDKAWNAQSVTVNGLPQHLQNWLSLQLGSQVGKQLLPIMREYYRLTAIREPEYMIMPFGEMEFHSGEFGNELERYLYAYDQLKTRVAAIESKLPTEQQDAYFEIVKYPIYSAALIAEKELEAQEARHIARPGLFAKDDEAKAAAALSLNAYQRLKQLFNHYASIGKGKWRSVIDGNDGPLQMPQLPGTLTAEEVNKYKQEAFDRSEDLKPFRAMTNDMIAKNANQWNRTQGETAPLLVPMLGHSGKAVQMSKGTSLTYNFSILREGDARFTLAAIPNYDNSKTQPRVSVSIDGAEPVVITLSENYNSASWKNAIWRGQILKSFYVTLSKGDHTIEIKALDDHALIDQWALDFDVDREYYVIPAL